MSFNAVLHEDKVRKITRRVFYTVDTAIDKGYGVCYDRDYGTATVAEALRDKRVSLPSNTNNNSFAGVASRNYSAKTSGQWIEIYEPGSVAEVYVDATVTIGDNTYVTCQIAGGGSGTFDVAHLGFPGRGTAKVMQSRTAAGLILAYLEDGPESGLIETLTPTAGGATTAMPTGVTLYAASTPASDATVTVANGTIIGQQKLHLCIGTQTTNDVMIQPTSNNIKAMVTDPLDTTLAITDFKSLNVASVELDAANEFADLVWNGTFWILRSYVGTIA